ncbi:hypothetical protein WMY93_022009 [Mugilogobius chulae]|uniref:Uncharacterized protein n=1 Tax=Mugilogobius chulae TaxID=88201 RepID=A0AAW0NGX7_9GOBI
MRQYTRMHHSIKELPIKITIMKPQPAEHGDRPHLQGQEAAPSAEQTDCSQSPFSFLPGPDLHFEVNQTPPRFGTERGTRYKAVLVSELHSYFGETPRWMYRAVGERRI